MEFVFPVLSTVKICNTRIHFLISPTKPLKRYQNFWKCDALKINCSSNCIFSPSIEYKLNCQIPICNSYSNTRSHIFQSMRTSLIYKHYEKLYIKDFVICNFMVFDWKTILGQYIIFMVIDWKVWFQFNALEIYIYNGLDALLSFNGI